MDEEGEKWLAFQIVSDGQLFLSSVCSVLCVEHVLYAHRHPVTDTRAVCLLYVHVHFL